MSSLPRRRRVKRPTLLVKRLQLTKRHLSKQRFYKPLYEKLKANNTALAKALSKEKQESQYLYSQNVALTSEVHDLRVAYNKSNDIIATVLKNAKNSLEKLVTMSNYLTNTIMCCQEVVKTPRLNRKMSLNTTERRDSMRRLSGKSPARGVVQPMVSGHTITKPTINLSRLNLQRVQNPPNLSDIDEVVTSPERSPATAVTTPVRLPMTSSLDYGSRRVDRLPERMQTNLRMSDEDERVLNARGSRHSGRRSGRRSRRSSDRLSDFARFSRNSDITAENFRSPRVALHDVSRLLQNSQSVNIRTLLDNSGDMELTQNQENDEPSLEAINETAVAPSSEQLVPETSEDQDSELNEADSSNASVPSETLNDTQSKSTAPTNIDDPLEGPSWLLNNSELTDQPSENDVTSLINNNQNNEDARVDSSITLRGKRYSVPGNSETNEEPTVNLVTSRLLNPRVHFTTHDEEDERTTDFSRFLTHRRGTPDIEEDFDDFTLMCRTEQPRRKYNFGFNDLRLPVLDSPIVTPVQANVPEPEATTNIQRITQPLGNIIPVCPNATVDYTIMDRTDLTLPLTPERLESPRTSTLVEQDEKSVNEDSMPRKRKRNKKKASVVYSSSDADWTPTPKRNKIKQKRKASSLKDPSSAKVVLEKLNETEVRRRSPSPESRQSIDFDRRQQNAVSDSDGSSVGSSSNTKFESSRPRRQKAPTNLREPSLGKKLRRN